MSIQNIPNNGIIIAEDTLINIIEVYDTKKWHEISLQTLPSVPEGKQTDGYDSTKVLLLGRELLAGISRKYASYMCENDDEEHWLRKTANDPFTNHENDQKNSTLSDRMDAMAVMVQKNCLLNWKIISELINMAKSKTLRIKSSSLEILYVLFMEILPNRKLRYIHQIDADRLAFIGSHLKRWARDKRSLDTLDPVARNFLLAVTFEDFLKGAYSAYIQILSDLMNDGIDFMQKRISYYLLQMIVKKPEQEVAILDLMISRLSHEQDKIASDAAYKLNQLILSHAGMKEVLIKKIGGRIIQALTQVNTSSRGGKARKYSAQSRKKLKRSSRLLLNDIIPKLRYIYRGFLFISELQYKRSDCASASEALKFYLNSIPLIFSRPDDKSYKDSLPLYEHEEYSRIIRCLSVGIERCFYYLKSVRNTHSQKGRKPKNGLQELSITEFLNEDKWKDSIDCIENNLTDLFRAAHKPVSLSTNIALLSLISKISPYQNRYYNLLYERILDVRMFESSNKILLLSLLDKSTESDSNVTRVAAFVKRLLQVSACIMGSNVAIMIAKICLKRIIGTKNLKRIVTRRPSKVENYVHEKRDPSFTQADNCHLWEYHLNRASFHPIVASKYSLMRLQHANGLDLEGQSQYFFTPSIFQELSIISGALQEGDFAYTQSSFWKKDEKPEPHQLIFKRFYEFKSKIKTHATEDVVYDPRADDDPEAIDYEESILDRSEDSVIDESESSILDEREPSILSESEPSTLSESEDLDSIIDDKEGENEMPVETIPPKKSGDRINKRKKPVTDKAKGPAEKRRRELELILRKTKGSFADASSIPELDKYL